MKKMNKKFVTGTAFALGAAAALTGCGAPQPNVYGPPESFDAIEEQQPTDYGPPETFDVEKEEQPDVYGPPEAFDEGEEIPEILYGPPEVLGLDDPDDWN